MYATILCLQQHDHRLVVLAAAICLVACAASFSAYGRAVHTSGAYRFAWTAAVGALLGSGVWSTHFVAMLAYQQSLAVGFELAGTGLSLLCATCGIAGGVWLAVSRPTWRNRALGGAAWGLSIAVMHFMGVAAMRLPATISWDRGLAAVAVAIGVAGAMAALVVAGDMSNVRRAIAGPVLLTLAICGLHFTGMGAVTLDPAPMVEGPTVYSRDTLALGLSVLVIVLMFAGGGMLAVDRFSRRTTLAALDNALDQAPAALAFFDAGQRLIFWNRAYAEVLDLYGVRAAAGLRYRDIVLSADGQASPSAVALEALAGDPSVDLLRNQEFALPDGRALEIRRAPTGDGGFILVLNDITAHRELMAREIEARKLAERASQAKSEFLANMSHEIRTPLNAVLGMAQVMRRSRLSADQRERLKIIDESGRSLLAILNDLLDLTKIEAAKLELESHAFDLEDVVGSTAAAYAPLALQKDLVFTIDVAAEAKGGWIGDSARIRQVLSNLIANAVKFTVAGEIRVQIAADAAGLRFSVADTGIGIPTEKLDSIFDKFTQADASTTRRFGGTGLGLAICEALVRLMGGAIEVASREGHGACFSFALPLVRAQAVGATAGADAAVELERPLRILAAEDNPTNQLILTALLEPLGADLTIVADGREAVDAVRRGAFDLVLMDSQMPVMSGIEATAAIRRLEALAGLPRTPILALTANVMQHQIEDYARAGMDGCIAKPIEAPKLFEAIRNAVCPPDPPAASTFAEPLAASA
jgi:signal transduction histidine kinase